MAQGALTPQHSPRMWAWSCTFSRVTPYLGTLNTFKWMGQGCLIYFSLISRAGMDLPTGQHRLCKLMSGRHLLKGFPTLLILSLPLVEGWCCAVAAHKGCRHKLWAEGQGSASPTLALSKSDSTPQLVGSAPPSTARIGAIEDNKGNKST